MPLYIPGFGLPGKEKKSHAKTPSRKDKKIIGYSLQLCGFAPLREDIYPTSS